MPEVVRLAERLALLERRLRELESRELPLRVILGCRVIRTTPQTIPNAAFTAIAFDTEINDMGGCWSGAYPTRLIIPSAGVYRAGASVLFAPSTAARRHLLFIWLTSGTNTYQLARSDSHTSFNAYTGVNVSVCFYANAGDYIEVIAYQDSGADLNTVAASSTAQQNCSAYLFRVA